MTARRSGTARRSSTIFDQLRKVIDESEWAKKNILIAVAGGAGDGTSGVRQAADAIVRQEIEKFAHIIFSAVWRSGSLLARTEG